MNFYEGVTFLADFLFIGFSALFILGIVISFIYYFTNDLKRTKEEERKQEERSDELDAEIDFIAEKLGYVKKTNNKLENEEDKP